MCCFQVLTGMNFLFSDPRNTDWSLIDGNPYYLKFAEEVSYFYKFRYKFLNKKNIELINSMGYKLFPYTVNDKDEMKKLISLGVDGIITDYPDKLKYFK